MEVILVVLVGLTLLCIIFIVLYCFFNHSRYGSNSNDSLERLQRISGQTLGEHLLANLRQRGLKRQDLQELLKTRKTWDCPVCWFENMSQISECVLCGATKSQEYCNFQQLNFRQACARKRKDWILELDEHGHAFWKRSEYYWSRVGHYGMNDRASEGYLAIKSSEDEADLQFACSGVPGAIICDFDLSTVQRISSLPFYEKYIWLLQHLSTISTPYSLGHLCLRVNRSEILSDSFRVLQMISDEDLHKIWRVSLIGEAALDAGGVQREWYTLLTQEILSCGLFIRNEDDGHYLINPNSVFDHGPNHLQWFNLVGKFIGRALLDGQVLPFALAIPILKFLLGVPLSFSDLQFVDAQTYKNMLLLRQEEDYQIIENYGLTFTIAELRGKCIETIELKENGTEIPVSLSNREEYLQLRWKFLLLERVSPQLHHLLSGFYQVIPKELIMAFDYKELQLILCGFATVDVADWQLNTNISPLMAHSELIRWFWQILHKMSEEKKKKFLQFCTGSSRVPIQGFAGLTSFDGQICLFRIVVVPYDEHMPYIRSHSCFNRIDMPLFETIDQLEVAMNIAINMEHLQFTSE